MEEILIEFHDIVARHRFDIGISREFKLKLTPNDDGPAYSQSLPTPINLNDDITVELALLHKYGIVTTLPFSKYASPALYQMLPNTWQGKNSSANWTVPKFTTASKRQTINPFKCLPLILQVEH